MIIDPPKEPASKVAERRWRNKALTERFKKMKATGEGAEQFPVFDGKKPFSTEVPKPPKDAPQTASIIENENPVNDIQTKIRDRFKKEIRTILDDHKERNEAIQLFLIERQRRRLLIEKMRRLEARVAQ